MPVFICALALGPLAAGAQQKRGQPVLARETIGVNDGWRCMRYSGEPDKLYYDERPKVENRNNLPQWHTVGG